MTTDRATGGAYQRPALPRALLLGQRGFKWRWLPGVALFSLLSWWTYSVALELAHWPHPVKYAALVLALVSTLCAIRALLILFQLVFHLGLARLIVLSCVIFVLAVAWRSEHDSTEGPRADKFTSHALALSEDIRLEARGFPSLARSVAKAPVEWWWAYRGHRPLTQIPGLPPPPAGTAIPANTLPELRSN